MWGYIKFPYCKVISNRRTNILVFQKMAEILDHADAAKALPKILSRIDAIKAELKELETKKSNQPPISDLHNSELERDIAYNVAEIDVLKSSVPEGKLPFHIDVFIYKSMYSSIICFDIGWWLWMS